MRIFLAVQQSARAHPVPAYDFWERYLKRGLEEAGHEWVEAPAVDWAAGLVPMAPEAAARWRVSSWSAALRALETEHRRRPVHLFLSYFFPAQVEPAGVDAVRSMGIPVVNFFCDNVRMFTSVPHEFHAFDLHWVPEFAALDMYARSGQPAIHRPMPCWVPRQDRSVPGEERYPPTFIGSRDEQRESLFADAMRRGAEFTLRGPGWTDSPRKVAPSASLGRRLHNQTVMIRREGVQPWVRKVARRIVRSPLTTSFDAVAAAAPGAEEYRAILRESTVAIGVNRYPSFRHPFHRPDSYSRLRDIEAPMLGACYLTEWAPGLDRLFEPGLEIETYRTAEELVEQLRRLRGDRIRRWRLRLQAQRRALADHTIARSIEAIARRLGVRG